MFYWYVHVFLHVSKASSKKKIKVQLYLSKFILGDIFQSMHMYLQIGNLLQKPKPH